MAVLIAPCAVTVISTSCSGEPHSKCAAARGNFSATYTLLSGTGACSMLAGDVLGVQSYNPQKSASDPTPNYNQASVAIQPSAVTGLLGGGGMDPNAGDLPYGIGNFSTSEPAADGFCVAPTLSVAHLRLPAVDAMPNACPPTDAVPAVDVQYAFTNVRVLSTAAALGTELAADLTYTTTDPTGAACTAKYHVRGVYPSVSCGAAAPAPADDGGAAEGGDMSDAGVATEAGDDGSSVAQDGGAGEASTGDDGSAGASDAAAASDCMPPAPMMTSGPMVPSVDLCSPYPNPAAGMATGSGINPDYAVVCDPNLLLCVLAKEPPSLR
jgi:hypothetical protein